MLAPGTMPAATFYEHSAGAYDDRWYGQDQSANATSAELDRVQVGNACYRLVEPLELIFGWIEGIWACYSDRFDYVGRGSTPAEARRDWEGRFHARFQALYSKRPFEMTSAENRRWGELLSVVDVAAYREETPLSIRQIGQVRYGHMSYPTRIDWLDGGRDNVDLDAAPPEFASCRSGQWIDAVVVRDASTNKLKRITHLDKIATVHTMSDSDAECHLEETPKADLPTTEWDWPGG